MGTIVIKQNSSGITKTITVDKEPCITETGSINLRFEKDGYLYVDTTMMPQNPKNLKLMQASVSAIERFADSFSWRERYIAGVPIREIDVTPNGVGTAKFDMISDIRDTLANGFQNDGYLALIRADFDLYEDHVFIGNYCITITDAIANGIFKEFDRQRLSLCDNRGILNIETDTYSITTSIRKNG